MEAALNEKLDVYEKILAQQPFLAGQVRFLSHRSIDEFSFLF